MDQDTLQTTEADAIGALTTINPKFLEEVIQSADDAAGWARGQSILHYWILSNDPTITPEQRRKVAWDLAKIGRIAERPQDTGLQQRELPSIVINIPGEQGMTIDAKPISPALAVLEGAE